MCLLTNERYITYQMGFSFGHLGHAPGVGHWGTGGEGGVNFFFPNSTKFGVSYSHEWHVQQAQFFWSLPLGALGRGKKGQNLILFDFNNKVDIKVFKIKLCVSSHK